MTRNFNKPFIGFDGKPVDDKKISDILGMQLYAAGNGKDNVSGDDKLRAYHLSVQLHANPEAVELTTEDCALIKSVAENSLVAGAYGQVVDIIEGD